MYHLFTIFKIALWNAYHRKYQLLLAFLPSTLALLTAQGFILACPQLLEYLIATSIGQTGHLFISMIILAYGLSYGAGRIFSELTDYLMMRVMNDLHQRVRQTTLSKVLGNAEANSIASHLYAAWERADQAIGSILNALVFLLLPKAFTLIAIWAIVSLKYGSYVSLAGVIGGLSYALWLAYSFKKVEHAITIQNDAETFLRRTS